LVIGAIQDTRIFTGSALRAAPAQSDSATQRLASRSFE
jgi:hypothetical protein